MSVFSQSELKKLYRAPEDSSKNQNGLVTIIGGSKLFHGAPLFSLVTASRIVDMVFFASPEPSIGEIANKIKSHLLSFIWVPWDEAEEYVKKSDSSLIGPGFMRFHSEKDAAKIEACDEECQKTTEITKRFLLKFPDKHWVIDAGSLQVLNPEWIPEHAILTPNQREYKMIFGDLNPEEASKKYSCTIVIKGPSTFIYSENDVVEVRGGNPGLTKGGSGDVEAGLTVALLAKNEPILAASAASFLVKKSADELYSGAGAHKKVGTMYNSDDLTDMISQVYGKLI